MNYVLQPRSLHVQRYCNSKGGAVCSCITAVLRSSKALSSAVLQHGRDACATLPRRKYGVVLQANS